MKTFYVLVFLLSTHSLADEPEKYFEQAKKYTLKIKSSVLTPFDSDSSKGTGMGSGFVVDSKRGWAVTNAHVVSRSPAQIQVSSFGRTLVETEVLYIDSYLDVAFIKVPQDQIQSSADLDCTEYKAIGAAVGAFGHPWGLPYTGTKGIISGHNADAGGQGEFLQTDAPINPGNSGGPLIDLKSGKVVGMSTASLREAQNTNFAVPTNQICHLMGFLKNNLDPSPPRLPFSFFKDDDNISTLKVAKKHPDASIGVMEGDLIVSAFSKTVENFVPVKNEPALVNALRGQAAGVKFKVMRNKKEVLIEGKLSFRPNVMEQKGLFFAGMLLRQENEPELSRIISKPEYVIAEYVEGGSVANGSGFKHGDIIESINGELVTKIDDCQRLLGAAAEKNKSITIKVQRLDGSREHFFSYFEKSLPSTKAEWLSFKQDRDSASRLPASGK